MSKPNLPELPLIPWKKLGAVAPDSVSAEAIHDYATAYAEEAVRQALAAQVPVLTDAMILHRWDTHVGPISVGSPINDFDKIAFARAVLMESASGHKPAPVDTSPGHSTVEQAAIRQALKGMQRWFGKWPEFVPADDKVTDAVQAVAAMNAVLPETRDV